MTLIAGLGNPGGRYAANRHNVGFMALDILIKNIGASLCDKTKHKGELYRKNDIFLLKPLTFMNLSGESVRSVKEYYKIENLIAIHDDIDLLPGALRFKTGGGHGGHNGLRSIDSHCSKEYHRVRIGIGRPEIKEQVADYCLSDFTTSDKIWLNDILHNAADGALALCEMPLNEVSSKFTKSPQP
ncbi:MAG: peptidyl-tRNA hydrolase, family [Pseudomonadota bacterium]